MARKTTLEATGVKPLDPAKAEKDPKEDIKGTSTASSLLRIAADFRQSASQGHPGLSKAADIFETEAKFLNPDHAVVATKEDLQKAVEESRAAVDKAAAVLADPKASATDHAAAIKDLGK